MQPGTAGVRERAAALTRAIRVRVRLRTRLRRVREAWRHRFPRRLPRWGGDPERGPDSGPNRDPKSGPKSGPDSGPDSGANSGANNGANSSPAPASPPAAAGAAGPVAPPPATTLLAGLVVADPRGANPRGRAGYQPRGPAGRLSLTARGGEHRWEITRTGDGTPVVAGRLGEPLTERQCAVLAQLSVVACEPDRAPRPEVWSQVVVQLAMSGVVLAAPRTPGGLSGELAGLLASPLPARDADPLDWEVRSVQQRRLALRHHGAGLGRIGRPPAVSAVLVTKRPQLAAGAVAALAAQTYPDLEIVLGVHGGSPPPDLPAGDRPLQVVPVPAAQNLGEALAVASARASGTLITKVDDDDRYGPEHIWDLVLAWRYAGATVVGRGAEFVYLEPKGITVRRRMAAETDTDTVAGGTLTLPRDALAGTGGWPAVPRSVDRALLDQVLAAGGTVYRTHPIGFIYTRHGDGHTWDPGLEYFLRDPVRTWRGLPRHAEFGTEPGAGV